MNLGGPAHQASYLSGRRFHPDRYETLLVHGQPAPGEESMADLAESEGARTLYLPSLRQPVDPIHDTRALAQIRSIVRRFRPDLVHTHTAKAGFLGRQAALIAGGPRPALVHTFHGHVLEGYFGKGKTTLYRNLERRLGRRTDRLIGVSRQTVDDLVRLGVAPREKFSVVPLGLDLDPFARARASRRRGPAEASSACRTTGCCSPSSAGSCRSSASICSCEPSLAPLARVRGRTWRSSATARPVAEFERRASGARGRLGGQLPRLPA